MFVCVQFRTYERLTICLAPAYTIFSNGIALKLAGDDHRAALALDGARLWDPSGKHLPMEEWVQIPFACAHAWPALAVQALKYVEQ